MDGVAAPHPYTSEKIIIGGLKCDEMPWVSYQLISKVYGNTFMGL